MTAERVFLLWDVDHTLIENGGASKATYSGAFELLVGRVPDVQPDTHGRTDLEIMANLFRTNGTGSHGFEPGEVVSALILAMVGQRQLLIDRGYVLAGAAETLLRALDEPHIVQSVLTGNIPENALVKLSTFELDRYLDLAVGGYGTDSMVRSDLVAAARGKVRLKYGYDFTSESTVLVGDTVRDVEAARNGGALVIGVATGVHSVHDLADAGADAVIESLQDSDVFFEELARILGRQ